MSSIDMYPDDVQQQLIKDVSGMDEAVNIALQYGLTDGSHHKMWVIDQMIRKLTGDKYEDFRKMAECGGEYEWDEGIAP